MASTPLALMSSARTTKPGRWWSLHVRVIAPGSLNSTTVPEPTRSAVWAPSGPLAPGICTLTSGILSPTAMVMATPYLGWGHGRATALEGDQPSGSDHHRHGCDGPLLSRGAGRPAGRPPRQRSLPPLLLRDRPGEHDRLLRVPRRRPRTVRQAGRGARPAGGPVRPPVVQPARRGGAAQAALPAQGGGLRGDRRGRPRVHTVDLLHRPVRDRPGSVVVGHRRHRKGLRLRRRHPVQRPGPGRRGARDPGARHGAVSAPHQAQLGVDEEKWAAAVSAAELVEDGMAVGLGTGSTVAYLLPALAARRLDIRC